VSARYIVRVNVTSFEAMRLLFRGQGEFSVYLYERDLLRQNGRGGGGGGNRERIRFERQSSQRGSGGVNVASEMH
jgi:hypothetical protein